MSTGACGGEWRNESKVRFFFLTSQQRNAEQALIISFTTHGFQIDKLIFLTKNHFWFGDEKENSFGDCQGKIAWLARAIVSKKILAELLDKRLLIPKIRTSENSKR